MTTEEAIKGYNPDVPGEADQVLFDKMYALREKIYTELNKPVWDGISDTIYRDVIPHFMDEPCDCLFEDFRIDGIYAIDEWPEKEWPGKICFNVHNTHSRDGVVAVLIRNLDLTAEQVHEKCTDIMIELFKNQMQHDEETKMELIEMYDESIENCKAAIREISARNGRETIDFDRE